MRLLSRDFFETPRNEQTTWRMDFFSMRLPEATARKDEAATQPRLGLVV